MKTVIIGGGISGLTLAYLLSERRKDLEVTVLEADSRAGGKVWTEQAGTYLCEKGPNGFLDNKPRTLELCKDLGVDPLRSNENSKKRYIFVHDRLNTLPESPVSFIKSDLLSWGGKLRLMGEIVAPKGPEDETVADFITRRLGREALEKLIDPMVSGIYAGDPSTMSITSCFPRIKELEQQYGSLIRAMIKIRKQRKAEARRSPEAGDRATVSAAPGGTLTSFAGGAQTLTDTLTARLGNRVRLGVPVQGISREEKTYRIHANQETLTADVVVLASPAYASADIVRDFDKELSGSLTRIPYPHVSVVCLGFRKEHVAHSLNGFGFLVPHRERRKILGTLWDSSIFPNRAAEGHALLRTMVGGAQFPDLAGLDDDTIINIVLEELKSILGFSGDPEMVKIYRWEQAIPQYLLGHGRILADIDDRLRNHDGLFLTGNAYRGIGINDCVENSYKIAERIIEYASRE